MRIAVCLSGQSRTWRTSSKNIKNYFNLPDVHVDYFIHTWDTNTYRDIEQMSDKKLDYKTSENESDNIKLEYNPVLMEFEVYDKTKYNNWEPLFYSFMKSVWLKKKHELENDFEYDIVIKARFDVNFKQEGNNVFGKPFNKFYIHNVFPLVAYTANELFEDKFPTEFNQNHFDDVFFYSDSKTMDIISKIYTWYKDLNKTSILQLNKNECIKNQEYFYGPGTLLYTYLIKHTIHPMSKLCIPYYIVRKEVEELGLDSINDWEEILNISHKFYWELREKGILENNI